jgi:hypothetical protein
MEKNIQVHPYARLAREEIKHKILEDNRSLTARVEDFKASELAKKIMTKYENYHKEIISIVDGTL